VPSSDIPGYGVAQRHRTSKARVSRQQLSNLRRDPRRDGLTATEARELARELNATLLDMKLMATSSHPDDDFNIEGLYTRRSPHPAIHLMR
jgi:hypothetical protein